MPNAKDIISVIGEEKFNKLITSISTVSMRERILFWQEQALTKVEEELNCSMPKTPEQYIEYFSKFETVEEVKPFLNLKEIENELNIKLPESYVQKVENIVDNIEFKFDEFGGDPEDTCRYWYLKSPKNLNEEIRVFGSGKKPFYNCLELFLKLHLEFTGAKRVHTETGTIAAERVNKGFVIAEENGDYIYLDKEDNYSVWLFYHDGCDVKKVADSFEDWYRKGKEA